jgi:hypothetical protein
MDHVYLMRSGDRFKIGRAKDVGRRWRTFRTADPAITVEHVIPCRQASALEAALHRKFDHKHIDLEWFRLTPQDIIYIKSLGGSSGLRIMRQGRRRWRRWVGVWLRMAVLLIIIGLAVVYFKPGLVKGLHLPRLTTVQQVAAWSVAWIGLLLFVRRSKRRVR